MERPPEELTVTFVGNHYPAELIKHLKYWYKIQVQRRFPGIYYITGLMFPVQILVNRELSKKDSIWPVSYTHLDVYKRQVHRYGNNQHEASASGDDT